ncbi:hypothetical protein QR685DRAFT_593103 [Neurospora intermedia]|uniref:Uncharacterized protein n=1 Tax=Neurospora intermedia TaxID=5142 RepID=A0ABR3DNP6_NEUIN
MGISFSTLAGWVAIICVAGFYTYNYKEQQKKRELARKPSQRHKLEEKQQETRKEPKEKIKKQRTEPPSKIAEEPEKAQKPKQKAAKAKATPAPKAAPKAASKAAPVSTTTKPASYSSDEDDGIDNREFARQFASIKQGTVLNTKKQDEKRQKSVKQSRALEREVEAEPQQATPKGVSAPSSTTGVDADDDESSVASPEVKAQDAGDVSDMLEPTTSGPSVLRLTDTDKVKQKKAKKEKPMEKVETKKQRQNRKKAEAEKAAREEAEKARQVLLEKQRREARIAEGRAAKDGSAFMAAQAAKSSAWTGNGANGSSHSDSGAENNGFVSIEPLDTFSSSTPAAAQPAKAPAAETKKPQTWMSSLPTEEEQMQLLRDEEAWNTVQTKKSKSKKNKASATDSANESESAAAKPQEASTPVPTKPQAVNGNKSSKIVYQQSAFAALSPKEEEDEQPHGLGEESYNVYSRRYDARGRLPLSGLSVEFRNLSLIHGGHFNHALVGPCTDKRQWIVTFRISCMKLMAGYGN